MTQPSIPVLRVMLLCLLWSLTIPLFAEETTPSMPKITAEQALTAYDRFRVAPETRLNEAPTFLRYMQGGAVHTVLNNKLLFFMYRAVPPDVQAVLYAAYMGANLDSQLRSRKQGDDPTAGMAAVLAAYASLQKTHPDLKLAELDALAQAAAEQGLEQAVLAMADGAR
jgi:hypothetical protein